MSCKINYLKIDNSDIPSQTMDFLEWHNYRDVVILGDFQVWLYSVSMHIMYVHVFADNIFIEYV